jgi:hypothetical protein
MHISRHDRFEYSAAGVTVVGSTTTVFSGAFFVNSGLTGKVSGTARVRRANCDTGKLSFRASLVLPTGP